VASTSVTIPASLGAGPIRLNVSFGGDATNLPASTSVPIILYTADDNKTLRAGGYAMMPSGMNHFAYTTGQETTVRVRRSARPSEWDEVRVR
ncbi:MAG TPA: hypothetical protein VLU46_15925, partial [Thermoanaerobaculia bacterium]|nr:hypothetical protein [Thermoanaerobaculia bacterium]